MSAAEPFAIGTMIVGAGALICFIDFIGKHLHSALGDEQQIVGDFPALHPEMRLPGVNSEPGERALGQTREPVTRTQQIKQNTTHSIPAQIRRTVAK